jgi:hypothetical protein
MSSPVLNAKLVTTALTLSYEAATETFKNTPNANNWAALVEAMYALQNWHFKSLRDQLDAATPLCNKPIGSWVAILSEEQRNKEPK